MEHALFYLRQLIALGMPLDRAVIKTAMKYGMNAAKIAHAAKDVGNVVRKDVGNAKARLL